MCRATSLRKLCWRAEKLHLCMTALSSAPFTQLANAPAWLLPLSHLQASAEGHEAMQSGWLQTVREEHVYCVTQRFQQLFEELLEV